MAFIRRSGSARRVLWLPKKASTAMNPGDALIADGSGAVDVAVSTSTSILGFAMKTVASTDSDYAANTLIPVELVSPEDVFEVDVDNTLTTAMVGLKRDLTDKDSINATGTSHNQVTIVGFISATKALVVINGAFQYIAAA